jgi:hypothetical protein
MKALVPAVGQHGAPLRTPSRQAIAPSPATSRCLIPLFLAPPPLLIGPTSNHERQFQGDGTIRFEGKGVTASSPSSDGRRLMMAFLLRAAPPTTLEWVDLSSLLFFLLFSSSHSQTFPRTFFQLNHPLIPLPSLSQDEVLLRPRRRRRSPLRFVHPRRPYSRL